MSTAKSVDLSKVVVFLGSFDGVDDILKLSENSRYEFVPPTGGTNTSWMGDQSDELELKPPFMCLTIGEHLFDPQGWVLGSHGDSDKCDLQVAENNQTGISRRLIRFDISPATHNPRITLLSERRVRIRDGNRVLTCRPGEPMEFSHPVVVDCEAVRFRAWPPKRTNSDARKYKDAARVFSEDILRAVPKYIPSIRSQPETVTHNIRYGKDGAVYVNEWGGVESKGAHASVMKVKDMVTGHIYGAKEPYYKLSDDHDSARKRFEALQMEYNHIVQLDHVS